MSSEPIGERQSLRVAEREIEIGEPFCRRRAPRALENRGREIEAANPADVACEPERKRARAAGKIHRAIAVARLHHSREPLRLLDAAGKGIVAEDLRGARELLAHKIFLLSLTFHFHRTLSPKPVANPGYLTRIHRARWLSVAPLA